MTVLYDRIGVDYAARRRPDARWMARIRAALGDAERVVNVGAGSGSYEPARGRVVAVEPSEVMLAQRPSGAAPAVQAIAEALPFADGSFDAALAVLTLHHWSDPMGGLAELRRVARRQVLVTWSPEVAARELWFARDYLPEIFEAERGAATLDAALDGLPGARVEPLLVPADCTDGFLGAWWRRPEAYLDAGVRGAISGIARLPDTVVAPAVARLADDLASGRWAERCRDILDRDALDMGYRLVVRGA